VKLGSSDTFRSDIIGPRVPLAIERENIFQRQQLEIRRCLLLVRTIVTAKTVAVEMSSQPKTTTLTQSAVDIKVVAIPVSLIESLDQDEAATSVTANHEERQPSFFKKMGDKYLQAKNYQKGGNTQFVRMPVSEYERFWAKDSKGRYCGTEPEGCEEGRRLLKERLQDVEMQQIGKKDVSVGWIEIMAHELICSQVEADIIRDWKPLKERTGWTHTAVSGVPSVS